MINGIDYLKKMYPNRDEKDYQPSGMDLRLGNVFYFDEKEDDVLYGLIDGEKILPEQKPLKSSLVQCGDDDYVAGWKLMPGQPYIGQVKGQIKIGESNAQIYLPRSTLLRGGVNVYTALGDLGYNGHLSFLIINHGSHPFFIQEGERFAQLVDFEVRGGSESYDGDYQEEEVIAQYWEGDDIWKEDGDILNLDDEEWTHKAILYRLWDKGIQCLMADIWADNNVAYLIGCYATAQEIAHALGVHEDVIYQTDVVSSLTIINLYQEKCIRKNKNTYTL